MAKREFGPPIDMWSLGCTICELFLGRPLFSYKERTSLEELYWENLSHLFGAPSPSALLCANLNSHMSKKRLSECLQSSDHLFLEWISGFLSVSSENRMTPLQALRHPFMQKYSPRSYLMGICIPESAPPPSITFLYL